MNLPLRLPNRCRRSPFHEAVVAEGVSAFTPYNRMLLPVGYGDPEGEYHRLMNGVSMWDVGAERQVQIAGPDAVTLTQLLSPRHIESMVVGQGKYVALCDHDGFLLNDPIVLRVDDDRFWFSIADSDVRMWASAIAAERGLDVTIDEPDVSPLAVQGPMAEDVVASIFGDWVRDLRYFWFGDAEVDGIPLKVARSGWSKQGGFELYLMDGNRGVDLWNVVQEAGAPWGIAPGAPTPSERIESGLLSWAGDTDDRTTPFEVRLRRFVDLDVPEDVVGIEALRRMAEEPPARHQLGIVLDGDEPAPGHDRWFDVTASDGTSAGSMTNGTWGYGVGRNIGFGLLASSCQPGDRVEVHRGDGPVGGRLTKLPFERAV